MPFRIRSILVASDLTAGGGEVLRTACALADLTEAELHVIHAADRDATPDAAGDDASRAATHTLREQLHQALPRQAKVTSSQVESGRAHEVILRRAGEVHADLIVVGPHRERLEAGQALGTTADRIVRTSDEPCLIVHGPVALPLRRVLVPSDLSDAARGALDLALIWASALRLPTASGERTRLDVLHVVPHSSSSLTLEKALDDEVAAASERTGVGTLLNTTRTVSEADSPAEEILLRASQDRADLLVLGTHGESATSRELIGGVASAVARRAQCAVLLVPPAWWKARQAIEGEIRPKG